MKKLISILLAVSMILTLAVTASAFFEPEEAFGEVKFSIGKQTAAWSADGTINDGEYFKVDIDPTWLSYSINDNNTDADLAYAKSVTPELYMSWDENYVYTATRYTETQGHDNEWDDDPASMWYSGAVQFNYANFDEVASEYRLEYGVGLTNSGNTIYTVWADGTGEGYEPTEEDAKVWIDGNTLTYETRCPWSAFADEDNTGYKEGNGFNFCLCWSIGKGQDYTHIQLAQGCSGNGKHAEYFAQVTLAGDAPASSGSSAGGAGNTVAHWRFQKVDGYYTGSVDNDNLTFVDLTGNGNDLVTRTVGNGDQLDIFSWDDGCDIPTAKGETALKFDNTKAKAATVDPYSADETSYTGGYTSGKYLETVADAPINAMTFENGFSFEIVYKLSSELDNNYNRYTGLFSRQGVDDAQNEPPFSIALTEWNNDANGTLGVNATGMQYVHIDPDYMKTNQEYNDGAGTMYGGEWHHILVTADGDMTEIYIDGNDVALVGETTAILVTDPSYSWEVGVGRKLGDGHENDSKNENSPKGMIRRLFAGDISEIRVTDSYMDVNDSLFYKSSTTSYEIPEPVVVAEDTPAAPEITYPSSGTDGNLINGTVIGNAEGWGGNAAAGAAAAFDGDPATFFDPLDVGNGFCGMDAGEPYILDKVVILSRYVDNDWNERFEGAKIQGSNDGENWTTLWTSDTTGTAPDYYTVTEFENNTGYSQFRYYNDYKHGDVAEVEFYGQPGSEAPAAESKGFTDVNAAADGKNVITGYEFVSGTNGNGGEGPENLWDGQTSTKFCTGEFPIESIAKLDGTYDVTGFTMATANDNADWNGRSPSAWTISVSADGENWTELASGDDTFFEETNFTYYAGEGSAQGVSYVKFNAEGAPSGCFQVSEVTLFGDKAADVTEELTTKEEAPNTFDFGVVAAVAAVISLGGFAIAKKKH